MKDAFGQMNKPVIDIIVTHYDEPWDVGRKLFLMLSLQRNVDFKNIRVILVQDGKDDALDWRELFSTFPYKVKVVTSKKHVGVSAARNIGIENSEADWILFCDFDDTFSDVYSVSMILNVLPTNEADVLWFKCYKEEPVRNGRIFVKNVEENFPATFGKMYRRSMLNDHRIRFNEELKYEYESAFNRIVLSEVLPIRVMRITTSLVIFIKTFREGSYTYSNDTLANRIESIFFADLLNVYHFHERGLEYDEQLLIVETFFETYYLLNTTPELPSHDKILNVFAEFYNENKEKFETINHVEKEVCFSNVTNKIINLIQQMFNVYNIETVPPEFSMDEANKWLETFSEMERNPVIVREKKQNNNERIVVYCGTRNTYENILASVKSLLATTHVDKIYLMIEDDEFLFEVPDCVQVMNVSDQEFFAKSGPNYGNSWSYMCLMRAAFAKLLPQHSRVLSLDIDIVVMDDISELWDIDLSNYYFAGVKETERKQNDYCNFGVIMMNLDKIRMDKVDDKIIHLLNTSKQQCPEQDAFNTVCEGNILLLPPEYNYTPFSHLTGDTKDEKIIHYAGITYWKNFTPVRKYADKSFDEIMNNKKKTRRVAVYCGTREVYNMMVPAAKSLVAHTKVDKIYFLIEDDKFPEALPDCIECINVKDQEYFSVGGPNYDTNWTYMVLMRAALPKILPDEHVVLSLDNDTIVNGDISAIWDTDISDAYFAAVPETRNNHRPGQKYHNFGVVLFNLDYLRSSRMCDKVINDLNINKYPYNEQDCMNNMCAEKIVPIPSMYNESITTEPSEHPLISHYCGPYARKIEYMQQSMKYKDKSWDDLLKGMVRE